MYIVRNQENNKTNKYITRGRVLYKKGVILYARLAAVFILFLKEKPRFFF
jgi:hypothetical protein